MILSESGHNVVSNAIRHTRAKSCPRSCTPPCNDESEESAETRTPSFSRPQVDRSGERERGAYLCDDCCCDESEDAGYEEARPVSSLIMNRLVYLRTDTGTVPIGKISSSCDAGRKGHTDTTDEV